MKLILCIFALLAATMANKNIEETLKAANDQFTANMFQEVIKAGGDKSVVLSAFSVLSPLAQLALASEGESHDEILKVIGFSNDNVTKEVFRDVNSRLKSVKGVELKQANKVYVGKRFQLNDQFAAVSRDVFNSEVQNINFAESKIAANEINEWVEDHTNHRIKNLVNPDSIDASTAAVLVNAIYFKGKWKNPFKKDATSDRDFHVTKDKKISVPMMYQSDDFKYGESQELDAKILEMVYEGEETSLVVVLPNKVDGINDLIVKLKNPASLNGALENMYIHEVQVHLPKFKIETTTNLKEVLEKMNVNKLFDADKAKLSKLLKNVQDNLFVSDATQKAFIEVNEEGAEAAAANQFTVTSRSGKIYRRAAKFTADRPFYYELKRLNVALFNGVYRS